MPEHHHKEVFTGNEWRREPKPRETWALRDHLLAFIGHQPMGNVLVIRRRTYSLPTGYDQNYLPMAGYDDQYECHHEVEV